MTAPVSAAQLVRCHADLLAVYQPDINFTAHSAQLTKLNELRHSLLNKVYFTKLSLIFSSVSLVA